MKVTALMVVAMMDALTAYQGIWRPAKKKSCVVSWLPFSR